MEDDKHYARQKNCIYQYYDEPYERWAFGELFNEIIITGDKVILIHLARLAWISIFITFAFIF